MTTALLATFLMAHGLLHLAIWLPKPDPVTSAPFSPQHSGVLSAVHVTEQATKALSVALAATAAGTFSLAGIGIALSAAWTLSTAVAAALTGLLLKVLYFHPWLSIGVLLDLAVLAAATTGWPLALT